MRRFLPFIAVLALLLLPALAQAAPVEFPLVPCGSTGQEECTPCHLFEAFSRIINLVLFGITGPIAAFMIVLAGGMMLLGGAAGTYSRGKTMLSNTLMGVTIILLSWAATNFLIKSISEGSGDDAWYQFSCPAFLEEEEEGELGPAAPSRGSAQRPAAELTEENRKLCTDRAGLAGAYKTNTNPNAEAPSLTALMSCIERDPVVQALMDRGQRFTYERSNPICNLTRGYPVCGRCAHGANSCHYGGKTGTQGAMGVDYNAKPGTSVTYVIATRVIATSDSSLCKPNPGEGQKCRSAVGEAGLFDEIYRAAKKNGCLGQIGLLNYEGNHTHVSTKDCDVDARDGVRGRSIPD